MRRARRIRARTRRLSAICRLVGHRWRVLGQNHRDRLERCTRCGCVRFPFGEPVGQPRN